MLIGAACVAVGGALWFLSQDQQAIKFDTGKHTVEELRKIVRELFVEGATLYCSKLVMIKNLKANGELTQEHIDNMRHK
jgi:hypothetical protein